MRITRKISYLLFVFINVVCYADQKINASLSYNTEVIEQGKLVSKRSLTTHIDGIIRTDTLGIYSDLYIVSPLQYKTVFPNRWAISGGILKKITDHFTADFGIKYTFLQRLGFEHLHQWTTYYTGIRSDLLMSPKFYFSWDPERKQWGLESSFKYDFDLSVFDCKNYILAWETRLGFLKGRKPYGRHPEWQQGKYKYYYIETEFLLKRQLRENIHFFLGPKLVYNTGGTQSWTFVNTGTHRSHFCGLSFGLEVFF